MGILRVFTHILIRFERWPHLFWLCVNNIWSFATVSASIVMLVVALWRAFRHYLAASSMRFSEKHSSEAGNPGRSCSQLWGFRCGIIICSFAEGKEGPLRQWAFFLPREGCIRQDKCIKKEEGCQKTFDNAPNLQSGLCSEWRAMVHTRADKTIKSRKKGRAKDEGHYPEFLSFLGENKWCLK